MSPPLTPTQTDKLKNLFYGGSFFGRDRLFKLLERDSQNDISRRQVSQWLSGQEIAQTFRRPLKKNSVSAVTTLKLGHLQTDTMDMGQESYRGYKAIFSLIDTYSRKLYCVPLKAKTAAASLSALKQIMRENPRMKISTIQSDNGSEFKSEFHEFLVQEGIRHNQSQPHMPQQNALAERSNSTVRRQISMYMMHNRTKDWVSALPNLVAAINAAFSEGTGKSPDDIEAAALDDEIHEQAASKILRRAGRAKQSKGMTLLQKGQLVRKTFAYNPSGILKPSRTGYFAAQKFRIASVVHNNRHPNVLPSYKLETLEGETLKGLFPRYMLLPVPDDEALESGSAPGEASQEQVVQEDVMSEPRRSLRQENVYEVDYITAKRRYRGKVQYLVVWKYWPESDATWENISNLKNAKGAIKEFEQSRRRV